MMNKYLRHPYRYSRIIFYYIIGTTIGRLFYSHKLFNSRYFSSIGAPGWKWVCISIVRQRLMGKNSHISWPCSPNILVTNGDNIIFDYDDLNNFWTLGNYFQSCGRIYIGKGTYIAPNVGIITENHNLYNPDIKEIPCSVVLGEKCWIGMNSIILPGVTLGSHTIVGAGSVVTKSFPEGYCVIVGNPAKKIKDLCF